MSSRKVARLRVLARRRHRRIRANLAAARGHARRATREAYHSGRQVLIALATALAIR